MPSTVVGCVTAAIAAVPILLAGCGGGGAQPASSTSPQPASSTSPPPRPALLTSLTVLQWNPHWECFVALNEQTCGASAQTALSSLLPEKAVDFANVIEINEESDVYQPPSPWLSMTARCGSPVSDSTALMYNSDLWAPVGDAAMGCMEDDDRAFIVQTFESAATSQKVIFAGAHFPHGAANDALRNAVTQASDAHPDALGVVFAADTNREGSESTESILGGIVSEAMSTTISSAQLFPTCCHNSGYIHDYDRIGATFATDVTTTLLFDDPVPSWADIQTPTGSEGEFHKALLATFQLVGQGEAQSKVALA